MSIICITDSLDCRGPSSTSWKSSPASIMTSRKLRLNWDKWWGVERGFNRLFQRSPRTFAVLNIIQAGEEGPCSGANVQRIKPTKAIQEQSAYFVLRQLQAGLLALELPHHSVFECSIRSFASSLRMSLLHAHSTQSDPLLFTVNFCASTFHLFIWSKKVNTLKFAIALKRARRYIRMVFLQSYRFAGREGGCLHRWHSCIYASSFQQSVCSIMIFSIHEPSIVLKQTVKQFTHFKCVQIRWRIQLHLVNLAVKTISFYTVPPHEAHVFAALPFGQEVHWKL